jgi:hypothetical protein
VAEWPSGEVPIGAIPALGRYRSYWAIWSGVDSYELQLPTIHQSRAHQHLRAAGEVREPTEECRWRGRQT